MKSSEGENCGETLSDYSAGDRPVGVEILNSDCCDSYDIDLSEDDKELVRQKGTRTVRTRPRLKSSADFSHFKNWH